MSNKCSWGYKKDILTIFLFIIILCIIKYQIKIIYDIYRTENTLKPTYQINSLKYFSNLDKLTEVKRLFHYYGHNNHTQFLVPNCSLMTKETNARVKFALLLIHVYKDKLNNLAWFMDEGSLIGVSRSGSIIGTDDDF